MEIFFESSVEKDWACDLCLDATFWMIALRVFDHEGNGRLQMPEPLLSCEGTPSSCCDCVSPTLINRKPMQEKKR